MSQNNLRSHCQNNERSHCQNKKRGAPVQPWLCVVGWKTICFQKTIDPANTAAVQAMITTLRANTGSIMASLAWLPAEASGNCYNYDLDAHPSFVLANGAYGGTSNQPVYANSGYFTDPNIPIVAGTPQLVYVWTNWYLLKEITPYAGCLPLDVFNPRLPMPQVLYVARYGGMNNPSTPLPYSGGAQEVPASASLLFQSWKTYAQMPFGSIGEPFSGYGDMAPNSIFAMIPMIVAPNDVMGAPPANTLCAQIPVYDAVGLLNVTQWVLNPLNPYDVYSSSPAIEFGETFMLFYAYPPNIGTGAGGGSGADGTGSGAGTGSGGAGGAGGDSDSGL